MNTPQSSDDTTTLHIGKIMSARPPEGEPAADDSVTIIVSKAAHEAVAKEHAQVVVPKGAENVEPEKMLATVAYAYAKGVDRSEDIERKLARDTEFRKAVHGEVPDANAIRRFRRLNHGVLIRVFEKLFRFRRKRSMVASPVPIPSSGGNADDATQIMDRKQANARLDEVVFVDNMLKDE